MTDPKEQGMESIPAEGTQEKPATSTLSSESATEAKSTEVAGSCFIVGAPIDERDDITTRGIRTLQSADIVVSGDEAHAASLLKRYAISKRLLGISPQIEEDVTNVVLGLLEKGDRVVLLSAPSFKIFPALGRLIAAIRDLGVEPRVIPGVDVSSMALVMSGFPAERYYVGGRLPGRTSHLTDEAIRLRDIPITTVLVGGSSRIRTTLQVFGDVQRGRDAAVILRPTVPGEVVRRGPIEELSEFFSDREFDGDWLLILGPVESGDRESRLDADSREERPRRTDAARDEYRDRRDSRDSGRGGGRHGGRQGGRSDERRGDRGRDNSRRGGGGRDGGRRENRQDSRQAGGRDGGRRENRHEGRQGGERRDNRGRGRPPEGGSRPRNRRDDNDR